MLSIYGDYHTHTTHSHGKGSVEDNVLAAIKCGLEEIAIADHGPSHIFFGIRDTEKYLADIKEAKIKYSGQIKVFSCIEANIVSLDGGLDLPKNYINTFDKVLFGYHKMVRYNSMADKIHFLLPFSKSQKSADKNTRAYVLAMEKYNTNMISHPGYGIPIDKVLLAKEAAKRNVALEINAKHPEFTVEELRECAKTGVKFVIGSDAHSTDRVGDFFSAIKKAEEANILPEQIINAKKGGQP